MAEQSCACVKWGALWRREIWWMCDKLYYAWSSYEIKNVAIANGVRIQRYRHECAGEIHQMLLQWNVVTAKLLQNRIHYRIQSCDSHHSLYGKAHLPLSLCLRFVVISITIVCCVHKPNKFGPIWKSAPSVCVLVCGTIKINFPIVHSMCAPL